MKERVTLTDGSTHIVKVRDSDGVTIEHGGLDTFIDNNHIKFIEVLTVEEEALTLAKGRGTPTEPESHPVTKPSHYLKNGIEVAEVCRAFLPTDPELTQVVQYILRAPYKGQALEDLKKARRWLGRAIAQREGREGVWE